MESFDLEDVYDNEISPLLKQIIEICKRHKLPMQASFTYVNCPERGVGRASSHLSFDGRCDERNAAADREIYRDTNNPHIIAIMRH